MPCKRSSRGETVSCVNSVCEGMGEMNSTWAGRISSRDPRMETLTQNENFVISGRNSSLDETHLGSRVNSPRSRFCSTANNSGWSVVAYDSMSTSHNCFSCTQDLIYTEFFSQGDKVSNL